MEDLIEMRILSAVRGLLSGRVNEILHLSSINIPLIEFSDYGRCYGVAPIFSLNTCECSEKERLLRLDAYTLTVTFPVPESDDSELYCYAYSAAFGRAVWEDQTLGGVAERAVVTGKKYIPPKKPHCGEGWEIVITLRVTVINEQGTGNKEQ